MRLIEPEFTLLVSSGRQWSKEAMIASWSMSPNCIKAVAALYASTRYSCPSGTEASEHTLSTRAHASPRWIRLSPRGSVARAVEMILDGVNSRLMGVRTEDPFFSYCVAREGRSRLHSLR